MITQAPDTDVRLRKLRADLKIKTGDLKVFSGRLRRAQDFGQIRKATTLLVEFNKIKQTIQDVKQTIAELEAEGPSDDVRVAG